MLNVVEYLGLKVNQVGEGGGGMIAVDSHAIEVRLNCIVFVDL